MRRNYLIILLFSIPFLGISQSKYQSLFWEITSPNQTEPSYLYGTMHVSDKIAFYLNDPFYEALLNVEYVALESDPKEWLEAFDDGRVSTEMAQQSGMYDYDGFYRLFSPEPNSEEYLGYYLAQGNDLLNGILYRNSLYEKDFQQDTYLDMFIYQTSQKYQKKFTGLEDYDLSTQLVTTAMMYYDYEDDFEPWLTKLLKEKSYVELMEDAYRDQDLDFLDSLNNEINNELYNQFMIVDRNVIMANSIDSIIKKGTVFAGIGAAHLPGEMGVIDLLIEKGYTVKPIKGELTSKGEKLSTEIKNKRTVAPFTKQYAPDSTFSVQWLNKLYEFSDGITLSPDLTNGAYVLISRLSRYSYLFPDETCDLSTVDKLLFEKVPGEIIKKDTIEIDGYPAIDLLNKTKDGNYQHYTIVETPLELIIFKMDGPQDYVTKYGQLFFDSIDIQPLSSKLRTVNANFNGYQVEVPSSFKIENNSGFASYIMHPFLQAYNPTDSSFYFVSNLTLSDLLYIEDDRFEAKMMHKRMYENLELENPEYTLGEHLTSKAPIFKNDSIPTGDSLFLQSILAGNQYYLLGYYGSSATASEAFFKSFKQQPFQYHKELELKLDTILNYSVTTYNDPPYHNLKYMFGKEENKEKRKYEQIVENYYYTAPNKEEIKLTYLQYPLYRSYENIDTLWALYNNDRFWQKRYYRLQDNKEDDEDKIKILHSETGKLDNKFPYLDLYLGKKGSTKYIQNRFVLSHGVLYQLAVMQDSLIESSPFVSTFFETFIPLDTAIGYSPFEDKTSMFLEDVYSADTLRKEAALKSIYSIQFDEKYLPNLYALIDTFPFTEKELKYKANLIGKVGKMNIPATNKYITQLFQQSEYNSVVQIAIIRALANHRTEESSKKILELLEYDIPLPESFTLTGAFRAYFDSLELATDLFPELLKYSTIEEYKSLVFGLLSDLRSEKGYNANKYKKFKEFLITEARIELKRLKGKELKNSSANYKNRVDNTRMIYYITLLAPFQHQAEVHTLFQKINSVDDVETLVHLALAQKANGRELNTTMLKKIVDSEEKINELAEFLLEKEEEQLLKSLDITQDKIALAELKDGSTQKIKMLDTLYNESLELNGDHYQMYVYRYKLEPRNTFDTSSDKWRFAAICYKMPKKGKLQLSADPYYKDLSKSSTNIVLIADDKEEEEKYYEKSVEYVEYENRKRVVVEVEEY